ncbi:MAG TPA: cation:proton antiporter [Anaerolineae bacterium]
MHQEMLLLAGILVLGILCQWLAWRLKIPAILPLLAAGFLVGPITGLLRPQALLGDLFFPVVSLSVSVILFEGALTLHWTEVRNTVRTVRNLITVGAVITWVAGALAAYTILSLSWQLSVLFGALIVVTGPTVINPLLRNVRPTHNVASILKWEGILIDPLGALLAVLVFDFIVAEGPSHTLGLRALISFLEITVTGSVIGLIGGAFIALMLRRYLVPDYLRDIAVLTTVAVVFAVSDLFYSESGLLAVTVMGIFLANLQLPQLYQVWHFKERLSILLISVLFIILAADVTLGDLSLLDWRSLVLLAVIIFIIRPLAVQLSALGSTLTWNERLFLSWIAPRGIVAAAVSSLFAFRLVELNYAGAPILAPLTFLVIVGTVLLQGSTAKPLARWLGVAEAEPQGFLLVGAHEFPRMLAQALQKEGFIVRLVDTNWHNVREARRQGLDVHFGNILSEVTESDLDLSGIGRLLALTSNDEANALACVHLQDDLGSSNVYQLPPKTFGEDENRSPSRERLGRLLFHARATYENLDDMLHEGAAIKKTKLTEQFTYDDYRAQYGRNFVPLLFFRGRKVRVLTVDAPFNPQPGWTLVSLVSEVESSENVLLRSAADEPDDDTLLKEAVSLTQKIPRRSS